MSTSSSADRNLLFGILALQMDFVSREQLIVAMQAWVLDKSQSLGQVLAGQGILGAEDHEALDRLMARHVAHHDGSPATSLAAQAIAADLRSSLDHLGDAEVSATLIRSRQKLLAPPSTVPMRAGGVTGGRYRVVRLHARGGLGQVSLAVDEELHREVALKEIQPLYAQDTDSQARFLREAEITGRLEHPGIVPVYGLDRDEKGRPRYAMRFIHGDSLRDALKRFHDADLDPRDSGERGLALRGLLGRFVDVCNAVGYAHSKGVLHRDIKPANVMLGDFGETLVVDWGLAKVLGQEADPEPREDSVMGPDTDVTLTQVGQSVGTPAFMSPEQAGGQHDRLAAASDVFSLGATLYNVLTGQPPYPGPADDSLRLARACQPPPARQVNARVPAALEAVCARAMAARPEDRYGSARELAGEVERWLADEPVKAYREPLPQRIRRWSRRHRTVVSTLVVLLVTTLFGLGVGLAAVRHEQSQTALQLKRAEENLNLAQKAVDQCFLVATKNPLLQKEKMQAVRKLLLEQSLEFYRNFDFQRPKDQEIQRSLGQNLFRVGYIREELGQKSEAIRSYTEARSRYQTLVLAAPDEESYQINLAHICNNLALLHSEAGDFKQADAEFDEARQLRQALADRDRSRAEFQADLAQTLTNLGELRLREKRRADARRFYAEAIQIQEQLLAAHKDTLRHRADLAGSLHNLSFLLRDDTPRDALAASERARDLRDGLVKADPDSARYKVDLAETLNVLGALHSEAGREEASLAAHERARELLEKLVQESPDSAGYKRSLADTLNNLGDLKRELKRTAEARGHYERAITLYEELVKGHPDVLAHQADLAGAHIGVGLLLRDSKPTEALRSYDLAVPLLDALGKHSQEAGRLRDSYRKVHEGRARALEKLHRHAEAVAAWGSALGYVEKGMAEEMEFRIRRAASRAQAGDHGLATKEMKELESRKITTGDLWYEMACVYALAAAAVPRDTQLSEPERLRLVERYGSRAVEMLGRARQAGLFKDAQRIKDMMEDVELKAIQGRADFKAFAKGLEGKRE